MPEMTKGHFFAWNVEKMTGIYELMNSNGLKNNPQNKVTIRGGQTLQGVHENRLLIINESKLSLISIATETYSCVTWNVA